MRAIEAGDLKAAALDAGCVALCWPAAGDCTRLCAIVSTLHPLYSAVSCTHATRKV